LEKEKEYVAELLLGVRTDTQDTTGTILEQRDVCVTQEAVRAACESFVGDYLQVPPMYSALKIDGKKLYELARAGKEVERKARPVQILELEILEIALPVVKMRVLCSKGTYIRTLCEDIGNQLGCGGAMQSLRRTKVGKFSLQDAIKLGDLQKCKEEGNLQDAVIGVESMFSECPAVHVKEESAYLLENGNAIPVALTREGVKTPEGQWVRMRRMDESFAAIYTYDKERNCFKAVKMFLEKE
jgi:tRNA pseudouridine55 synthase